MPKMKTKSAAKKRFTSTSTGKLKARPSNKRHLMTNKSTRGKREGRSTLIMGETDTRIILENYMPYARSKRRKHTPYTGKKEA